MLYKWLIVLLPAVVFAPVSAGEFSHEAFAHVLRKHVDADGSVDYSSIKQDRKELEHYLASLESLSPAAYDSMSEKGRIALLINAYNAFVIEAIVDHYPIESSFLTSLRYPKNSIQQIDDVWKGRSHRLMGEDVSLNEIEHERLRKQFNEPRIHMALNCASIGCPPLLGEPFTAEKLHEQLDAQSRKFMADNSKFRIDKEDNVVYLSPIFKWFGEDFFPTFEPQHGFADQSRKLGSVLNFAARYLEKGDAEFLKTRRYKVKWLEYDWTLNEQRSK